MNTTVSAVRGCVRGCRIFLVCVLALGAAGCVAVADPVSATGRAAVGAAVDATRARMTTDQRADLDLARYLQAFPPAAPGQSRWVIALPEAAREDLIQVELLPGVRMPTDCNHHLASAKVQSHTVGGWGYTYDVMDDVGPVIATLMGCPDEPKQVRDVPVSVDMPLRRYNSRAPIVFYAPQGVTLRYRLWRTEGGTQGADRR